MSQDKSGALVIDADPRNADWIRIVRAQRLAGYRMPHWASLWLWWIGHDREEGTYWKQVGAVAKAMGFPPFVSAIQHRAGQTLAAQDFRPLLAGQVRGDDDTGPLVGRADHVEINVGGAVPALKDSVLTPGAV